VKIEGENMETIRSEKALKLQMLSLRKVVQLIGSIVKGQPVTVVSYRGGKKIDLTPNLLPGTQWRRFLEYRTTRWTNGNGGSDLELRFYLNKGENPIGVPKIDESQLLMIVRCRGKGKYEVEISESEASYLQNDFPTFFEATVQSSSIRIRGKNYVQLSIKIPTRIARSLELEKGEKVLVNIEKKAT